MSDPAAELVALLDRGLDGLDRARLVVAYSGGPDSTALTRGLIALGVRPLLVHVDHGLRADHAHEVAWVRAAAGRWGLELVQERVAAGAIGASSIEAQARAARYAILARVAAVRSAAAVLTAHTADDQAETVLLRLTRGTGARGLAGIPSRRPLAPGSSVVLARPTLDAPRTLLRAALAAWDEGAYEDPTNASRAFLRNRVRHDRLGRWPIRVRDALVRVARASGRVADRAREAGRAALRALEDIPPLELLGYMPRTLAGEGAFAFDRARLRSLPRPLWSYVFEERLGGPIPHLESAHVERLARHLEGRSGQIIEWPDGWRVHVFARWLLIARRRLEPHPPLPPRSVPSGVDVRVALDPLPLVLHLRRGVSGEVPVTPGTIVLPESAHPLVIRGPRSTDVIARAGGRKGVRAVLSDAGWAGPLRAAWPVVVAGEQVLWVPGAGVARAPDGSPRIHASLASPS